jgi:hypothetical protein
VVCVSGQGQCRLLSGPHEDAYCWLVVVSTLRVKASFDYFFTGAAALDNSRVGSFSTQREATFPDLSQGFVDCLLKSTRGKNPPGQ